MLRVDEGILLCAFRYAITRQSYVVDEVGEAIISNRDRLSPAIKNNIISGIKEALPTMDQIDARVWKKVLLALTWGEMGDRVD